jgi:ribosome recycling factor
MDQETIDLAFFEVKESMNKALEHLENELMKVRTGKASPNLVSGIKVDYYGTPTLLNQVASVSTSDSRTIVIQPWERSMIAPIERAIFEANLGITPQNDGEVVRLGIPPLTEERRKEMVKLAKSYGEDCKVSVRICRRDLIDTLKKAVKEGYPEDAGKKLEDKVQQLTNEYSAKTDSLVESKEKELLQI